MPEKGLTLFLWSFFFFLIFKKKSHRVSCLHTQSCDSECLLCANLGKRNYLHFLLWDVVTHFSLPRRATLASSCPLAGLVPRLLLFQKAGILLQADHCFWSNNFSSVASQDPAAPFAILNLTSFGVSSCF